jgi:hypothetical protein
MVGLCNQECCIELSSVDGANKKYIENFDGETTWKLANFKGKKQSCTNIKIDVRETGCEVMNWTELIQ